MWSFYMLELAFGNPLYTVDVLLGFLYVRADPSDLPEYHKKTSYIPGSTFKIFFTKKVDRSVSYSTILDLFVDQSRPMMSSCALQWTYEDIYILSGVKVTFVWEVPEGPMLRSPFFNQHYTRIDRSLSVTVYIFNKYVSGINLTLNNLKLFHSVIWR